MNNMNNCSDQTREKLKAAYMSRDLGVDFTREKFDRIIAAAEQERIRTLRRRKMIKVALVSLILCAACSGLLMGLITWEDASADNDDETKIIKQGDNLVIGNGVVDGDDIVGATVEEYASIEDIPEEIREKAHFITMEGFEVEHIKLKQYNQTWIIDTSYSQRKERTFFCNEIKCPQTEGKKIIRGLEIGFTYKGYDIYELEHKKGLSYYIIFEDSILRIYSLKNIEIETILDGLMG